MEHARQPVSLRVDQDHVAWLSFDTPRSTLNLLSLEAMRALDGCLSELESTIATGRLVAVVACSGKPGTFIAGADVNAIAEVEDFDDARHKSREGQRIFRRLDRLTVPTIAAIDGICLGGGTELALGCDHRIASDRGSTQIGLPEVKLGLLPGWGGSVRLPRLIGTQRALGIILAGGSVSARKAERIGLVDRVVHHEKFGDGVTDFTRDVLAGRVKPPAPKRSPRDRLLEDTAPGRALLFSMARKQTLKKTRGRYPAPIKALEVVESVQGRPIDDALEIEAAGLAELACSEVSRNLVRIFLIQQNAKRALSPAEVEKARPVERAAVLGAGVMGGEIAELIAAHDVPVVLKDIDQDALDLGMRHASHLLRKGGERGIFTTEEVGLKFALIEGTLDYDPIDDADLVIEAVVERMAVKQGVLRETEARIAETALYATNTSSLSVTELATASERPAQVLGLHFFNPVHRMPLVEVVRTAETSVETVATALVFSVAMGKTPVITADSPGFLVNRLLAPYLNEAGYLLEEGASIEEVDGALVDFGMPMGPCRLLDEVGFDISEHVAREMEAAFGERMRPASVIALLQADGRLGRKNGRGFYTYVDGKAKDVDRDVSRQLARHAKDSSYGAERIRQRCLYVLVNEASRALDDSVVQSANDVDLAMVMGTGFPPFRGGLLRWADVEGLRGIVDVLRELEEVHGARFAVAPGLAELAERGDSFTT